MLSGFKVSRSMESEQEVIRCLRLALTDAVKDIVQQIVSVMSSGRNCKTNLSKHGVPERLRESIPREWNYIPKETKRKESSKGIFVYLKEHIPRGSIFQDMRSSKVLKIIRSINYISLILTTYIWDLLFSVNHMIKETRNENDSNYHFLYLTFNSEIYVTFCVHAVLTDQSHDFD